MRRKGLNYGNEYFSELEVMVQQPVGVPLGVVVVDIPCARTTDSAGLLAVKIIPFQWFAYSGLDFGSSCSKRLEELKVRRRVADVDV